LYQRELLALQDSLQSASWRASSTCSSPRAGASACVRGDTPGAFALCRREDAARLVEHAAMKG
jgi:hypothetical protein